MKKQTIKFGILLLVMVALLLTTSVELSAQIDTRDYISSPSSGGHAVMGMTRYVTFEEALTDATDVVVAQFVERRPFGQSLTEYEFVVHERVFGNAADRVFAYVDNRFAHTERIYHLPFTTETQYLLMLERIDPVYTNTNENSFHFLTSTVLDLNNPSKSTMYNEPLSEHSTGMNFNRLGLSRKRIIAYVSELTKDNTPFKEPISSDSIEDIIEGSPHVLVVEISEPWSLSHEALSSDWMSTDIYNTTVVSALKGDMEAGDTVITIFFADTVQTGERHIIAIEPVTEANPYLYEFTTRNSLFRMDQLDEILHVLGQE